MPRPPPWPVASLPPRVSGPKYPDRYRDRKSTRLNSSHLVISYAVFCLKKKKKKIIPLRRLPLLEFALRSDNHTLHCARGIIIDPCCAHRCVLSKQPGAVVRPVVALAHA